MIYEYPKEFIVPVVFAEDLVQKRKESIRKWNLFMTGEDLEGNQYEEPICKYNIVQEIAGNDNIKTILNDIDEEYAVSQTLGV